MALRRSWTGRCLTLIAVAALCSASGAAAAQTPAQPSPAPPAQGGVGSGNGVIRQPAHVDPGMTRTLPGNAHTVDPMPVIRPSHPPAGNPEIVPK